MSNIITIGKRLVPLDEIALVEPYETKVDSGIRSSRPFKARVVLVNRESLLIEQAQEEFATEHGFRWVAADQVALNPVIRFRVETFEPAEDFTPTKAYATRLRWNDMDGKDHSRLLLTAPEETLSAISSPGNTPQPGKPTASSMRHRRSRSGGRQKPAPAHT